MSLYRIARANSLGEDVLEAYVDRLRGGGIGGRCLGTWRIMNGCGGGGCGRKRGGDRDEDGGWLGGWLVGCIDV